MLVRRVTYALCAVFLLAVIGGAIANRETQSSRAAAPPTTILTGPPPPVVHGMLPVQDVVRAHVGDAVDLTVTTASVDDATIDAMGLTVPTSASVPGTLDFVATAPGRYPVVLDSGAIAGTVVVTAAPAG